MFIAIEGVIGVGKTTLARMLQPKFDAELQLEVFEENPFLADFYSDRDRGAFPDVESQVNRGRYLVDVLPPGTLCTNCAEFDIGHRYGQFFVNFERVHVYQPSHTGLQWLGNGKQSPTSAQCCPGRWKSDPQEASRPWLSASSAM